jgi:hypothetical protein
LLRDLYKRTPDFYPDKPFLDAVFNTIDFINKQIDQSSAKENRKYDITTVQTLLGPNVKVMVAGHQILRQTDVRLTKLRSAPGIVYPLNDLVLLASCVQTPDQVIIQSKILNFRFANGHDNISFVHEGHEHVVFSTAQDKIAWLDPFVEMRLNLFSNTHLEFSATVSLLSLSVCSDPGSLSSR